jgi:hypothetical protein
MLHEIAITPGVFEQTSYATPGECDAHFLGLRQALLEWTIVRDLRDGEWKEHVVGLSDSMSPKAKEILKKLCSQGRVFASAARLENVPADDEAWCREAIASHAVVSLLGVLSSDATKGLLRDEPLVAAVSTRGSADWWKHLEAGHPGGHQSGRTFADYRNRLDLILRHARSLMFLDPHLDPTRPGYARFLELIRPALDRGPDAPMIQIHRCCYEGSGERRNIPQNEEWEQRFRSRWGSDPGAGKIEVFIWDDFHDRHLVSDLIGLQLGNGFDLSTDPSKRVSWSRLSRQGRDDVQREADPSARCRTLHHRFRIAP